MGIYKYFSFRPDPIVQTFPPHAILVSDWSISKKNLFLGNRLVV